MQFVVNTKQMYLQYFNISKIYLVWLGAFQEN